MHDVELNGESKLKLVPKPKKCLHYLSADARCGRDSRKDGSRSTGSRQLICPNRTPAFASFFGCSIISFEFHAKTSQSFRAKFAIVSTNQGPGPEATILFVYRLPLETEAFLLIKFETAPKFEVGNANFSFVWADFVDRYWYSTA